MAVGRPWRGAETRCRRLVGTQFAPWCRPWKHQRTRGRSRPPVLYLPGLEIALDLTRFSHASSPFYRGKSPIQSHLGTSPKAPCPSAVERPFGPVPLRRRREGPVPRAKRGRHPSPEGSFRGGGALRFLFAPWPEPIPLRRPISLNVSRRGHHVWCGGRAARGDVWSISGCGDRTWNTPASAGAPPPGRAAARPQPLEARWVARAPGEGADDLGRHGDCISSRATK
jgi:hypothetical protein